MSRVVDENPVLVTRTFVRGVNGAPVVSSYGYTAVKEGTLWDAELIAWAERRAGRLAQRTAAQSAEAARPGREMGTPSLRSASAAGVP